jgi:cysteine desulfurase/selenocysteine lyase
VPVAAVREDFPILGRTVRGRPLAYLDSAATSQKPRPVLRAIAEYYERSNANVHRALHTLAGEATAAYEESRRAVQAFIGARRPAEVVFTRGATEAINLVAASWGRSRLREGDEILLTEMEHHSNLVPWQLVAAERGCRLRFIPFRGDGTLDLDVLDRLEAERIRFVALTHVSNVFGTVNDVRRVVEWAHRREAPVLVDAAQSAPHLPVDVQALGCDFLAFSGHKMCAPMGIGVLYGREELLAAMPPFMGGGDMIRAVWLERAEWNELPYKFEAGTPNVEGAVGLAAAIRYLGALGMENIRAYEERLTRYTLERLERVPGLTLYGPPAAARPSMDAAAAGGRQAVFSFNLDGVHPHDLAQLLDWEGIAIRAGHHCAHPLMRKLEVPATARASLYLYNTFEEIDRLAGALGRAREALARGL